MPEVTAVTAARVAKAVIRDISVMDQDTSARDPDTSDMDRVTISARDRNKM